MIIPIWKNLGESTHQLAKKVGKIIAKKTKNSDDIKATHTGTLDPLAEGVVIVLTGLDRFKKSERTSDLKTYRFDILFGISTDTHDLLGLQKKIIRSNSECENVSDLIIPIMPEFLGKQIQTQPAFSAQRIDGKSGFDLAKEGQKNALKKNKIIINSFSIIGQETISVDKLLVLVTNKISLVAGDFRQMEIVQNWKETCQYLKKNGVINLPIIKFEIQVTKRTYIRAIVRDIAKKIDIPATTFHIIRTKNGEFSKKDCLKRFENLL